MKIEFSSRFRESYALAPGNIRRACDKQLKFLRNDLRHPSLQAKKYDETLDVWQARITRDWRLYFTIEAETYRLLKLTPHP